MTPWLLLMETYFVMLRDGKSQADACRVTAAFASNPLNFPFADVQAAMALCLQRHHRRKRISYADAIGVCLARKRGLSFLTGDLRVPGSARSNIPPSRLHGITVPETEG